MPCASGRYTERTEHWNLAEYRSGLATGALSKKNAMVCSIKCKQCALTCGLARMVYIPSLMTGMRLKEAVVPSTWAPCGE
eukprot:1133575-Pelagomonas_calceolata.AAC.5